MHVLDRRVSPLKVVHHRLLCLVQLLEVEPRVGVGVNRLGRGFRRPSYFFVLLFNQLGNPLFHKDSLLTHTQSVEKVERDSKPRIDLVREKARRLQLRGVADLPEVVRALVWLLQ